MPITILNPTLLAAAAAKIGGDVPAGTQRIYKAIGVRNKTAAPVVVAIHMVAAGEAATVDNCIISRSVPAGKLDLCPELMGRGLNAAGSLWMSGLDLSVGYTAIDTVTG